MRVLLFIFCCTFAVTHTSSSLQAGNDIALSAEEDMTIAGANVHADGALNVQAGGDMHVESVQNHSESEGMQAGLSASIGLMGTYAGQVNLSVSAGVSESESDWTDHITTLTGGESVEIDVGGHLHNQAAIIANATQDATGTYTDHGEMEIIAGSLSYGNNADSETSHTIGASAGYSTDLSPEGPVNQALSGNTPSPNAQTQTSPQGSPNNTLSYADHVMEGETFATFGQGSVTTSDGSTIEGANTDLNNVQIVTLNEGINVTVDPMFIIEFAQDPVGHIQQTIEDLSNAPDALVAQIQEDIIQAIEAIDTRLDAILAGDITSKEEAILLQIANQYGLNEEEMVRVSGYLAEYLAGEKTLEDIKAEIVVAQQSCATGSWFNPLDLLAPKAYAALPLACVAVVEAVGAAIAAFTAAAEITVVVTGVVVGVTVAGQLIREAWDEDGNKVYVDENGNVMDIHEEDIRDYILDDPIPEDIGGELETFPEDDTDTTIPGYEEHEGDDINDESFPIEDDLIGMIFTSDQADEYDISNIHPTTSYQKQDRHIKNTRAWHDSGEGGYFNGHYDSSSVLNALHNGEAEILGTTSAGHLVIRYDGVTGYNNNPRKNYIDQPTNVFIIKGTRHPSVVPTNPYWGQGS